MTDPEDEEDPPMAWIRMLDEAHAETARLKKLLKDWADDSQTLDRVYDALGIPYTMSPVEEIKKLKNRIERLQELLRRARGRPARTFLARNADKEEDEV